MSHRFILRAAIGLGVLLVLVALGFAWSAGERDASLTPPLNTALAPVSRAPARNGESAAPPLGIESFDRRCSRCHTSEAVAAWTAKQSGNRCEALFEFLQRHRMAPELENRVIAALFAPGCSESQRPE